MREQFAYQSLDLEAAFRKRVFNSDNANITILQRALHLFVTVRPTTRSLVADNTAINTCHSQVILRTIIVGRRDLINTDLTI